jgi:large subunit ribosomal protein L29
MPTATELRELEDEELDTRLVEYRREMLNLRFQLATGQLDNYSRLNAAKRNVARVLTVLRDREIALAEGRDAGPVFVEQPVRPPRRRAETIEEVDTDDIVDDEVDDAIDGDFDGGVEDDVVDVDEDADEESSTDAEADEEDE